MSVTLEETVLRRDELLTADIRDITVSGVAEGGVRLTYLDGDDERTQYRVSVEHAHPGEDVDAAEDADITLLSPPHSVVTLTEVDG